MVRLRRTWHALQTGITAALIAAVLLSLPAFTLFEVLGRGSPVWLWMGVLIVGGGVGVLTGLGSWRIQFEREMIAAGRCRRCGYDLRASTGRCPECGHG